MGSFVLTAVLGVVRQSVIGAQFGVGADLDAYFAGNRVAETLFSLISGGALGSAFIPVLSRYLTQNDMGNAWRLAGAVLTYVSLIAAVVSVVAAIFAVPLVSYVLSPGATLEQQALTVDLLRIMLLTVVLFCVSGLCMAILNTQGRFFAASLTAGMYNIGLIIGALIFSPFLGIYGLAWGAVFGAILHLTVQLPTLRRIGFRYQFIVNPHTPGLGEVLRLMLPRVIGLAAFQLNFWVNTALTSGLSQGSLAALSFSFTLLFTILGVVGQSVGTAVFPTLAEYHAKGDRVGYQTVISGAMRGILFMALPASVGLALLGVPLVEVLFGRGRWTAEDSTATAWALGFYATGLVGFALQEILARAFYARRDTWTPVIVAVGGLAVNVILSLLLLRVIQGSLPGQGSFGGLAFANALTTTLESALLWVLLSQQMGGLGDRATLSVLLRAGFAAGVMGLAVYGVDQALIGISAPALIRLVVGAGVGAILYEGVAVGMGLPEARRIPMMILGRVTRRRSA
jgi:putative peptidoglycan lipid II flippase